MYFAFRRRLRDIAQATACECDACLLMPRLDLKIVVHHGSVIRHRIAGREELVGSDVIVAHRFLKNHVVDRLGIAAYALFSESTIAAMAADPVALGMTEYRDAYDDLGEVTAWVHDLTRGVDGGARAQPGRRVGARGWLRPRQRPAGAPRHRLDLHDRPGAPPALAGRRRPAVNELPTAPRRGVGTTNHCMHGSEVLIEEILDWRPTELLTLRTTLPNGFKVVSTFTFEDVPDGTRVRLLFTWGKSRREREATAPVRDFIADAVERGQAALHDLLVEEMSRRAAQAADEPPEPVAPGSMDRELLEPVRR